MFESQSHVFALQYHVLVIYVYVSSVGSWITSLVMAATKSAGIRYAPEDPLLPKPWRGLIDGKTGYIYFWNPETNVTQYQKPLALQTKPDSLDESVSVSISSSVQVQESSQVLNLENTTINDDGGNGRGSNGRANLDSGEISYQVFH